VKLLNPNLPPGIEQAGALKALVLDWAGTSVDFGSLAPVRTIEKLFAQAGVRVTEAEIRSGMGLPKRDHIRGIIETPRVSAEWRAARGAVPTAADAEELYQRFIPMQLAGLAEYSGVIPGVAESVQKFRARGLKIGSTTGYTREMLDLLLDLSAKQGFVPDCSVAPEDVGIGRPAPLMMYENAVRLRVWPLAAIAKVGDTPADIHEGLNAGAWSIGVAGTGNGIGVSYREFHALPPSERESRLGNARRELEQAGAHYVVDTLAELEAVIDDINARIASAKNVSRRSNAGA
jgi:phosphonoacetaldehyde hydrolase